MGIGDVGSVQRPGLPTVITSVVRNHVVGSPSPQAMAIANLTKILDKAVSFEHRIDICNLPRDSHGQMQIPLFMGRHISKEGKPGFVFDSSHGSFGFKYLPGYPEPLHDNVVHDWALPALHEMNRRLELAGLPFRINPVIDGPIENSLNNANWPAAQSVVPWHKSHPRFIEVVQCGPNETVASPRADFLHANGNNFGRVCMLNDYEEAGFPDKVKLWKTVLAHEIGHIFGIRHPYDFQNFPYLNWVLEHGKWGCEMTVMTHDIKFCTNGTERPAGPANQDMPEMPDQRLSAVLTLLYRPIGIAIGLIIGSMNRIAPQWIAEGEGDSWLFEDPRIQPNALPKSLGSADLYLLRRMYNFSCNASNIESNTVSAIEDPESQVVENLVATLGWMMLAAGAQKFIDQGLAQWPVRQWVATIISTMAVVAMMNREVPTVPALALSTTLFGNTLSKLALSTALGIETIVRLNQTSDVGSEMSHYLVAVVGVISGALVAGNIGSLLAYMTMSAADYTDFRNHQRTGFEPLVTSETTPLSPLGEHVQVIRNADRMLAQRIQSVYTGGDTVLVRVGKYLVGCIRQPSANQPTEEGDQLVEDGAHDIEMIAVSESVHGFV